MSQFNRNPHIPDSVAHLNKDFIETDVDPGLVHLGGTGLWQNWKNTKTGEQSLRLHTPKVVKQWCAEEDHYFEQKHPQKRIAICKHCKMERPFVLGRDRLVDGKFLKRV